MIEILSFDPGFRYNLCPNNASTLRLVLRNQKASKYYGNILRYLYTHRFRFNNTKARSERKNI